jgi:SAM-dependent methyltransferase
MTGDLQAQEYYAAGTDDLLPTVLEALRAAGRATDPIEPDDLALLDEFHGLGRAATVALAELVGVEAGMRVLDLGAGIGGPARTLARHFGAEVTALDPTARFCRLDEELCRRAGLGDRVEVVRGDGRDLPFADGSFDLVVTQAVWPSIEDKPAMLAEARRVLSPGGRLAIFEAIEGPAGGGLTFPVPWADGPGQSFVVGAEEVRELTAAAGFAVESWAEGAEAIAPIGRAAAAGGPAMSAGVEGVDLSLLMPGYAERMAALAENVEGGRIVLAIGVFRAA